MDARLLRLFSIQLLLVASQFVIFLAFYGQSAAVAVWAGGLIAGSNLMLLVRCARRRLNPSVDIARQTILIGYSCAVMRFVSVAALFMLGMGVLKLHPLALLMGFIAGQLVLVFPQTRKLVNK